MPFNYKSPGVYIEEVDRGARPIESAATSVLAMVGLCAESVQVLKPTEAGLKMVSATPPNTPTLITNWTEFINTYGDFEQTLPGSYLHKSVYSFFLNGGTSLYVVAIPFPILGEEGQALTADLFKGNAAERTGIAGLEAIDEVTIVACPDIVAAYEMGLVGEEDVKAVQTYMLNHCEMMKDRFAVLDAPKGMGVQGMIGWRRERMNFDSKYGALYYPWIKMNGSLLPPSGAIAGVYARVDVERGIHKAPANEVVRGAIGLERNVSQNEQDHLNPIGVNCIRSFPGRGIRIWGARTLSSDAQWRYINVRRLFCNVEESILQGTSWVVFEPNDQLLWSAIRRDIRAYLTTVWRSGALFGRTAEEAFYVKCDEETNPKALRDLGYCIIEVGIAPVKPAEFVVFRISQKDDGSGSTNE